MSLKALQKCESATGIVSGRAYVSTIRAEQIESSECFIVSLRRRSNGSCAGISNLPGWSPTHGMDCPLFSAKSDSRDRYS
jgi:hypothetical protein